MNLKKFLAISVIATSGFGIGVAHAGLASVGGVVWDTDTPLDFSSTSATMTQSIDGITGEVSGFGVITTLNGTGLAQFLPGGGELTFEYHGFNPMSGAATPSPADPAGNTISYSDGFVNVYVDDGSGIAADPNNPISLNAANTTDGNLWLAMVGHEIAGQSLLGSNFLALLAGQGVLDVTGGLASENFDTNTQTDGADFSFTTSFSTFPNSDLLFATGTGNFDSDSIMLPEPATLALLGLGLLGMRTTRKFI